MIEELEIVKTMEKVGAWPLDTEKDKEEQISKILLDVFGAVNKAYEWDSPSEIWFVSETDDWIGMYKVLTVIQGHIKHILRSLEPMPATGPINGVILVNEGWGLDSSKLAEGESWKDWAGKVADHLAAVECRMLNYYNLDHSWMLNYVRGTKEPDITQFSLNSDKYEGEVVDSLRYFMRNYIKENQ